MACLVALAASLAACATPPPADDPDAVAEFKERNDPIEPLNRQIFDVNNFFDRNLLEPVAQGYLDVTPRVVRTGIRNFIDNVNSPVVLANDLFQGEFDRAGDTLVRLAANSTLGVGGLYDFAADHGKPKHQEDFGQTLAVWGVDEGPYFVAPLLGPKPPRDLVGFGVDIALNPLTWVLPANDLDWVGYTLTGLDIVDARAAAIPALKELEASSIDLYAAVRNLYRQQRAAAIANRDGN